MDEAQQARDERERSAQIDGSYATYDEQPLDTPNEWGDLASFLDAAGPSQ